MSGFAGKSLLFIGGGEESYPGILRARDLGLKTAVLDRSQESPGSAIADQCLVGSIFDVANAVRLSEDLNREWPIDGVLSVATDAPVTVSAIAERLSLPGISRRSAELVSHKLLMKSRLIGCGIPTAPGFTVSEPSEVEDAIRALGGKVVVKPADSRGARGVSLIQTGEDCVPRFREALEASPSGSVLVERFLKGPQFSTESVVHDGRIATVGISTRNYGRLRDSYPFPVEDGGDLPATIPAPIAEEIDSVLLAAASALGITRSTLKGDLVIHDGQVFIIEVAGRLSGGYFATHEIPLSSGVDYLAAAFRMALGVKTDWDSLKPVRSRAVAQRYFFPEPGRVQKVEFPDWIKSHPDVHLFVVRARIGDTVPDIRSHPSRAGLVITSAESRQQAIRLAESIVQAVKIQTVEQ